MGKIMHEGVPYGGGNWGTFEDLSDVTITSIANGQVPIYDSTTSKWKNGNISTTYAGLTDVALTSTQAGQVTTYNSTSSKWENSYLSTVKYDASNTLANIIGDVETLLAAL
jgi:hypothetical protein